MVGPNNSDKTRQFHRCPYRGSAAARLWRGFAVAAALTLVGGCSVSGQLDSVFGGGDKSDQTGSITPPPGSKQVSDLPPDADLASAYSQDGQTCRDFLASYVSGSSQAWLQGEACKQPKGVWEVRTLKPWKRS